MDLAVRVLLFNWCHLGLWSRADGIYYASSFKGKLIDQSKSSLQLNLMRSSHKWKWSRGNKGFSQSVSSNKKHAFLWTVVFNLLIKDSPVAVHIICLFWSETRLETEKPLFIFWNFPTAVFVEDLYFPYTLVQTSKLISIMSMGEGKKGLLIACRWSLFPNECIMVKHMVKQICKVKLLNPLKENGKIDQI